VPFPESDAAPSPVKFRGSAAALSPVRLREQVFSAVLFQVLARSLAQLPVLDYTACVALPPELAVLVSSAARSPAQPLGLADKVDPAPLQESVASQAPLQEQVSISWLGQSLWISHAVSSWTAKNATTQRRRVRQLMVDIDGKLVSALNALHKELEVSRQKRGSFVDENDSSEEVNRRNKGKGTGED